jgi:hypothetical protein
VYQQFCYEDACFCLIFFVVGGVVIVSTAVVFVVAATVVAVVVAFVFVFVELVNLLHVRSLLVLCIKP